MFLINQSNNLNFCVMNDLHNFLFGFCFSEIVDNIIFMEDSTESGENMQVVSVVISTSHKKQVGGPTVRCTKNYSGRGPTKHQDRFGNNILLRPSWMRNGKPIFQGSTAEILTSDKLSFKGVRVV